MMNRYFLRFSAAFILSSGIALGIALAGPYYTLIKINQTLDDKDGVLLEEYIDIKKVRDNIKGKIIAKLEDKIGIESTDNIGKDFASKVIDISIDSFFVAKKNLPDNLLTLLDFKEKKLDEESGEENSSNEDQKNYADKINQRIDIYEVDIEYLSFTKVKVVSKYSSDLYMEKEGFSWKVTDIDFD